MYQKRCQKSQIFKTNMEKIKLLVVNGVALIGQDLVCLEEQLQHKK